MKNYMYDGYDSNAPIGGLPNTNADKFLSSSNVVLIEVGLEYYTLLLLRLEWNEVSQKRQPTVHETQTTNCTENSIVYVSDGHNINITSPGFPYGYATDLNCMWILKPEEVGRHAVFLFDEIDLEDTVNCLGDYVKIYSSNDLSNYKLLNTTCQVTPNEILQLYGDPYLKIHFVSDYYTNRTGFSGIAKSTLIFPEILILLQSPFSQYIFTLIKRAALLFFQLLYNSTNTYWALKPSAVTDESETNLTESTLLADCMTGGGFVPQYESILVPLLGVPSYKVTESNEHSVLCSKLKSKNVN
ncbi:Cubilin like [Pseudolycoriella hygida]|uniref:Cubilin like n=1 Tax=Pseudolycoriella hygida TaxID=35572 RepID=A0A9Q0N3J8_9DIPT|nr:Cubilin like [Pseudolycoriella hygida]